MATTTPINAVNATVTPAITGAGEFLKFVDDKLPSLFRNHPYNRLGGVTTVNVVNAVIHDMFVDLFIDCYGGEAPSMWHLTGLVVRYSFETKVLSSPPLIESIKYKYVENEKYEKFTVRSSVDHTLTFDMMIPPSSGLLILHQATEANGEDVFRLGYDAFNAHNGQACEQVDGKIYRIHGGRVFSSKGPISLTGDTDKLTTGRVTYNEYAVNLALDVNRVAPNAVIHVRSNNVEDKLINFTERTDRKYFSLLDITEGDTRLPVSDALERVFNVRSVDHSFSFHLDTRNVRSFEEFRLFVFNRLESGKNVIVRSRDMTVNNTVLILGPGNMLSRGVAGAVRVPATVTGLRSRLVQHPASRCLTSVSGGAMFDSKIKYPDGNVWESNVNSVNEANVSVMVFPSREVETFLRHSDIQGTIVDVVGMIRGLYSKSFDTGANSQRALFSRLLAMLPTLNQGEAPGFTDTYAVLCNNVDVLDNLVDRFPEVNSAVGTSLTEPTDVYFQIDRNNVIARPIANIQMHISYECFKFLQAVGAGMVVPEGRRFVDFNVDEDLLVTFTRRPEGMDDERQYRMLKVIEYVLKCSVDNFLAQTSASRAYTRIASLRMFIAPRQMRE